MRLFFVPFRSADKRFDISYLPSGQRQSYPGTNEHPGSRLPVSWPAWRLRPTCPQPWLHAYISLPVCVCTSLLLHLSASLHICTYTPLCAHPSNTHRCSACSGPSYSGTFIPHPVDKKLGSQLQIPALCSILGVSMQRFVSTSSCQCVRALWGWANNPQRIMYVRGGMQAALLAPSPDCQQCVFCIMFLLLPVCLPWCTHISLFIEGELD